MRGAKLYCSMATIVFVVVVVVDCPEAMAHVEVARARAMLEGWGDGC